MSAIMASAIMLNVAYSKCAKLPHYAERLYAECHYAECRGAILP
jgi:hypothetical protein